MTNPNYYQLAKQGDPDAIALYLYERLSDRCLTTQAKRNEGCLLLEISLKDIGDRETVIELVRQELTSLEARSITKVQIKARKENQKDFAWEVELELEYPKVLPQLDLSLSLEEEEEDLKDGLHGIGDVIRDRYRILEVLGQGGNGITYAAMDLQQKTKVAIKALSLRHMNDWKQIELFEREAKVLAQLDHPAIPKYFDYFTIDTEEDRAFYIVQELAQGQNLAKLVEAGWRTNEKGVRKIAEQVLNILIYLHSLNPPVIHRDIKPHNLIYDNNGKVFLVDFGAVQDTYRSTMARGSTVIGTFGYMAPEQFRGQAMPATDLFSLGATILFLLTHRSPSELPQERLRYDFRSKIQVSEQFAEWLQKMVEPDLEDRYTIAKQSFSTLKSKRIVWIPSRKFSWKNWLALSMLSCLLTAYIINNKWVFLRFYGVTPQICRTDQGISIIRNSEDLKEFKEYVIQSRIFINKFPYYIGSIDSAAQDFNSCMSKNLDKELLEILYQQGYQFDVDKIFWANKHIYIDDLKDILEWFISKNITVNKFIYNRLLNAYVVDNADKNIELVKFLIKNGADVNNNEGGITPLMIAIYSKNFEAVKILMLNGADPIIKTIDNKQTILCYLVNQNNKDILEILIKKGYELNNCKFIVF